MYFRGGMDVQTGYVPDVSPALELSLDRNVTTSPPPPLDWLSFCLTIATSPTARSFPV